MAPGSASCGCWLLLGGREAWPIPSLTMDEGLPSLPLHTTAWILRPHERVNNHGTRQLRLMGALIGCTKAKEHRPELYCTIQLCSK